MGLTSTDQARLAGVLPQTLQLADQLVTAAAAVDIVAFVPDQGGFRSAADQAADYADSLNADGTQKYAVAPPGKSYHQFGAAFDLNISSHQEVSDDAAYKRLADIGVSLGLTAGYYFTTRQDEYHFQLPGALSLYSGGTSSTTAQTADAAGRSVPRPAAGGHRPGGAVGAS